MRSRHPAHRCRCTDDGRRLESRSETVYGATVESGPVPPAMESRRYDAIIIGSGFGGSMVADALVRAGFSSKDVPAQIERMVLPVLESLTKERR